MKNINITLEQHLAESGLVRLNRSNLPAFAHNIASAYVGYSLFDWTFDRKCTTEDQSRFFTITFKTMLDNSVTFATSDAAESIIALLSPDVKATTTWDYIKAGGIKLYWYFGFSRINRITSYEAFADSLRHKYSDARTWYLYDFTTCPEHQHQGWGKKVLVPTLEWMDRKHCSLYLETAKDENIKMYEKYGFTLVESATVPGSNGVPHYCMLRKPQVKTES